MSESFGVRPPPLQQPSHSHSVTSSPNIAGLPLTPQSQTITNLESIDTNLLSSVELHGLSQPPPAPSYTYYLAQFRFPPQRFSDIVYLPMSSAKGSGHQHSASYTYGSNENQIASGVSQERSTASPSQPSGLDRQQQYSWSTKPAGAPESVPSPVPPLSSNSISSPAAHIQIQPPNNQHQISGNMQQTSHYSPTQTLPQVQPQYGNSAPTMMLPPLRMPHNTRMDVSYSPSTGSPAQPHYGFSSYPGTGGYQSRPQPYSYSGHVPQHSTSSSTGSEIWTPVSASGNGGYPFNSHQSFGAHPSHKQQPTTPSTIQPSVFPSWQSVSDSRTRVHQSTISPLGMLGSDSNRLDERRSSTPGQSGGDKWDRTAQSSVDVSPNTSDQLSSEDDVKAEAKDLNQVTYTTDAEVKQTAELKRMCFNCSNKSPPSWRKSLLHAGKILCNKCGIFERTHHRPRPPQNDDQKLRKQNQIIGATYRRDFPPNLQVMRDDSDGSQPGSPYSNVPSQATPMSATFPLSPFYPSPSDALMSSSALSHRRTNIHQQTSPSQHALATPVSSISAEMDPSSPLRTGYYAQRSSPYAQAYHNRRMYVQPVRMTSPVMPYSAGPLTGNGHGNGNGGPEQSPLQSSPMTGWNTGSRHNDAHIHSGLSTPSIGGHNDPMGSAATAGEETDEIDSASNGVKPEPS